jgi:hypothetical protein
MPILTSTAQLHTINTLVIVCGSITAVLVSIKQRAETLNAFRSDIFNAD